MSPTPATHPDNQVARPLHVLVPLIKKDLEQGNEASRQAGMPFYRAAGEKLIEARDGSFEGRTSDFLAWADRSFKIKKTQVWLYIKLVTSETRFAAANLADFRRKLGHKVSNVTREWRKDVDDIVKRAREEAKRFQEEARNRQQEREADKKLALRLIDIGYKVLAKGLHPDKGGSRDAMARLNRVRDHLKTTA